MQVNLLTNPYKLNRMNDQLTYLDCKSEDEWVLLGHLFLCSIIVMLRFPTTSQYLCLGSYDDVWTNTLWYQGVCWVHNIQKICEALTKFVKPWQNYETHDKICEAHDKICKAWGPW